MRMSETEKKGITVKIDADLHAQVKQYIEENGITMAEFVSKALDDELHPKTTIKEEKYMGNMRTMAFQVPEDLFNQIKDYLERHNMTQKQFVLGLIQDELDRDYEDSRQWLKSSTPKTSLTKMRKKNSMRTRTKTCPRMTMRLSTRMKKNTKILKNLRKMRCLWKCEVVA